MTPGVFDLFSRDYGWGVKLIWASAEIPMERVLEVYQDTGVESVLVGRLSSEDGKFVFRYDSAYTGYPISTFPRIDREYRSEYIWPFFAIRIPPLKREEHAEENQRVITSRRSGRVASLVEIRKWCNLRVNQNHPTGGRSRQRRRLHHGTDYFQHRTFARGI